MCPSCQPRCTDCLPSATPATRIILRQNNVSVKGDCICNNVSAKTYPIMYHEPSAKPEPEPENAYSPARPVQLAPKAICRMKIKLKHINNWDRGRCSCRDLVGSSRWPSWGRAAERNHPSTQYGLTTNEIVDTFICCCRCCLQHQFFMATVLRMRMSVHSFTRLVALSTQCVCTESTLWPDTQLSAFADVWQKPNIAIQHARTVTKTAAG